MDFLCASAALAEGTSRVFIIEGMSLLAVRRHGKVYLYRNRCPHRSIALNWEETSVLDPSASLIHCAHHGALFLIESGECVAGPCEGEALQALGCEENATGIWLTA